VKSTLLDSRFFALPVAVALILGCKSSPSPVADAGQADLARGDDLATHDGQPNQGADVGPERNDVLAQMPDASADAATERLTTQDGLASSAREAAGAFDLGSTPDATADAVSDLADGPVAETKAADAAADELAADMNKADTSDAAASGDETGCTGWNSLVRLSPAELVDLMTKTDPIVINVHIPYEGDIPGTDTSIAYDNVDAIETYLHKDHCADLVLICKSGGMSKYAGDELVKRGYLRVRDLAGGFVAWQAAGYPLLKDGGT
jgi:rhodanese-related sulfurtransferase